MNNKSAKMMIIVKRTSRLSISRLYRDSFLDFPT